MTAYQSALPDSELVVAPRQIFHHKDSQQLELVWRDGSVTRLDSSTLRQHCLCSQCRANRLRGITLSEGPVALDKLELFGVAGLQLFFADGHQRGVFPWRYLMDLGISVASGSA